MESTRRKAFHGKKRCFTKSIHRGGELVHMNFLVFWFLQVASVYNNGYLVMRDDTFI